jgi:hypothetical protein
MTRKTADADRASSHPVDPFIERVPDPRLGGFSGLPEAEQRWRARLYAAVYVWSGSAPFSWQIAMNRDPDEVVAMRAFVETLNERQVLEAFDDVIGGLPPLA